jgi:hypothetical protein
MMQKYVKRIFGVWTLVVCAAAGVSYGQATAGTGKNLGPGDVERIIKRFTANEREFRHALASYVFKRNALINTIGLGGQITGTYRRDSQMTFNAAGERFEKILFAPVATVPPGMVTAEDLEDLGGVNAFALEPRSIDQYNFAYVGTERIDELSLYVFDVTPKSIPDASKKIRLFTGRIWVDVDDLMIVKSKGKGVPETKINKFPVVETTRTQVDGKYWFPADARADDELVFDSGEVLKIRMRVKYTDYSVGRSEVRILDDDEPIPTPSPTPSPTPKKPE